MNILPAIDLRDGKCVRLYQGDFSKETIVNENPVVQAKEFERKGLKYLHVVDLDGALAGRAVNAQVIKDIKKSTTLKMEVGGGIHSFEQIEAYVNAGIDRVIIGSKALTDPQFVRQAVKLYGDKIAVGIDAKEGYVATRGWKEVSQVHFLTFAKEVQKIGVQTIIYTDIAKDGTLSGPNLADYRALKQSVKMQIIASGGVSKIADLLELKKLNLYGAIVGKAYYSGNITAKQMKEVEV